MNRRWEFDALRGLMLVLMMFTHLPSRLTSPLGQPFGFVSAAEGFVLLSAVMCGIVYGRLARRDGLPAMRRAFFKRALKVYLCQMALMMFLFTVVASLGLARDQPDVKNLVDFYLREPVDAIVGALLLVYQPPLLDILPMYVLFMLISPWVLSQALRHGWGGVMAVSLALWVAAQFGVGPWLHAHMVELGFPVPLNETGSFSPIAWQFLWVMGLWLGASRQPVAGPEFRFPLWAVVSAVVLGAIGFAWRHIEGQAPFGANVSLNMLFDKWELAPLRLINLIVLIVIVLRFGPWLAARMPRPRILETLGSASLAVFCTHLVLVLLVLSVWGGNQTARPVWGDVVLVVACFAILYAVARVALRLDRAPPRKTRKTLRTPPAGDAAVKATLPVSAQPVVQPGPPAS